MSSKKQELGHRGEELIRKSFDCFRCKRSKTLKLLPPNFKCASIICDFCGYLAQVKTKNVKDVNIFPKSIPSAAWTPQKERMDSGIYFPIFFVLISEHDPKNYSIFYLPADFQNEEMFKMRSPLSSKAKRTAWQGYSLNGTEIEKWAYKLK